MSNGKNAELVSSIFSMSQKLKFR